MDRKKIVDAILEEYRKFGPRRQEYLLAESLKTIADPNLLAFAINLGIDTDAVLSDGVRS